jgi:hypothetical protein
MKSMVVRCLVMEVVVVVVYVALIDVQLRGGDLDADAKTTKPQWIWQGYGRDASPDRGWRS